MTAAHAGIPAALTGQGELLVAWLRGLPDDDWRRPTRCAPWCIAELVAHLVVGLRRLGNMPALDGPAEANAADYYRGVARRDAAANRHRVTAAQALAHELGTPAALMSAMAAALRETIAADTRQSRMVRTRWGAVMSIEDFMATRVVESVVHGLDLTDARGDPPLLHRAATAVAGDVLVAVLGADPRRSLGWSDERLLRVATGREVLAAADARTLGPLSARLPVLR